MQPPLRPVPRAIIAAACALTAAVAASFLPAHMSAHRGNSTPAAATSGSSWARTVTGRLVEVDQNRYPTPSLHEEQLTHPEADYMGSTIRDHDPGVVAPKPISPDASIPHLPGIDVSSNQGSIDWAGISSGLDFVYAKATEATYYLNPDFTSQYNGPYNHGVIRGAYHFAVPSNSSGTAQADYFISHGGAWSGDGVTLPGALDIEYNPYGAACYGLSTSAMTDWIWNFVNEYAAREHAYPVIYSTTDWWSKCTGNATGFAKYDPFWVANYASSDGGALPGGWDFYTFWQYADHGKVPGDQDVFNGALSQLKTLASKG